MRDTLYNKVKALQALNVTAISTDTNTDGVSIGLDQSGRDYRVAMVVAQAGSITDGSYAVVPQESPNGSDSWTDVPAARLQGSGTLSASNTVAEVGVVPDPAVAPYLRVRITSTDTDTGGSVGAVMLLGSPGQTPIVR
jgi:hypothetical protein